jgi:hypothetical protein
LCLGLDAFLGLPLVCCVTLAGCLAFLSFCKRRASNGLAESECVWGAGWVF